MKKHIFITLLSLSFLTMISCSKSDKDKLEGKWQLRYYELPDGSTIKCDSVFYNFQHSSFSAICITETGSYPSFFGNYSLLDNKISINLLPDYSGAAYDKYLGWEDCQRTFQLKLITSKALQLEYNDTISVFRKY